MTVSPFVPPRINDHEEENEEPKEQQYNGSGFVFPKKLEASGNFAKIHSDVIYTSKGKSKTLEPRTALVKS